MAGLTLPPAAWQQRDGLARLCGVLGADAGAVRYVGGAVRDTMLGIEVADIDLATTLAPADVLARLGEASIKAVPTGIAHGTITAVLPGGPIEVTTLRRDVATDGRRATVAFTDDWWEDAARRDFTINALYADPLSGAIFDYFDGLTDLDARRVRFIGDPLRRIAEDHLRILRFFRFQARFGEVPDAAGLAACADRANDLMALSRERIAAELLKLLVARHAAAAVRLMIDRGIFAPVLPEITAAERLDRLVARERTADVAPDAIRRLAALLPADPLVTEDVGARLKLSKIDRRRLVSAARAAGDAPARVIGYRLGSAAAIDRLLLSERALDEVAELVGWTLPALPITGGELVARGITRGPEVAQMLRAVEERWIAEGFPDRDRTLAIADDAVAQRLRTSSTA